VPAGAAVDDKVRAVEFDYETIHRHVQDVKQFDRSWHEFFMRDRLRAMIVVYEDFIQTYETTVPGMLGYLGLNDPGLEILPPQYRQQADEISAEWERLYRDVAAGRKTSPRSAPIRARSPRTAVARQRKPAQATARPDGPSLIAYDLGSGIDLPLEPAPPGRPWMDATPRRFVYHCLPLVIANQGAADPNSTV